MSEHTHSKDDIKDFPSSLPADGGNSDTLDGKHADDFVLSTYFAELVGDSSVDYQINSYLDQLNKVYVQPEAPTDVKEGSLWLDTDEEEIFSDEELIKIGKIDGLVEGQKRLTTEIAVERARVNTFTALGEGSTTGDAELQDIRVGYDGTVYETAGEAVRGQITTLVEQIQPLTDTVFGENINMIFDTDTDMDKLEVGMINNSGNVYTNYGGGTRTHTPMIDISGEPVTIRINAYNSNGMLADSSEHMLWIAQYDANEVYIDGTRGHFNLFSIDADGTVATTGAYSDLRRIEKAQTGQVVEGYLGGGQATVTPADGAKYARFFGFPVGCTLDMEIWAGEYDNSEGSGLINDVSKLMERVITLEESQDEQKNSNTGDINAPLIATVFGSTPGVATDFSAVVIADLHGSFVSLDEANTLRNTYASNAPIFNAGDIINLKAKMDGAMNSEVATYMEKAIAYGVYHTIGQHEVGFNDTEAGRLKTNCMSHEEVFNTFIAPMRSVWGLPSLTTNYYYKDFGNTRLISLYQYNVPLVDDPNNSNCYKYFRATNWLGQDQINWLISTLNSVPDGYKVIIMMHQPETYINNANEGSAFYDVNAWGGAIVFNEAPVSDIVQAYIDKTSVNKTYTPSNTEKYPVSDFTITVDANFADAKGTFGHYITGDSHIDCIGYANTTKQRHIGLTSCNQSYDCIVLPKTNDERRYIVNLLGYCYSKGYVKLGRVGQQYSVTGQTRIFEKIKLT